MHFDFVSGMRRTSAMDRLESLYLLQRTTAPLGQSCNPQNSNLAQQHRHHVLYCTDDPVLFFRR